MKKAFTLIELLISIVILSMIMLFLYKTYSMLNRSNLKLKEASTKIVNLQKIKKVIYMDFLFAQQNSVHIKKQDKNEDFAYLQSLNSWHQRCNPFITYIVKNHRLYRLESLTKIKSYDLTRDNQFDIDYLGEIKIFKIYKSSSRNSYLINIEFKSKDSILIKSI